MLNKKHSFEEKKSWKKRHIKIIFRYSSFTLLMNEASDMRIFMIHLLMDRIKWQNNYKHTIMATLIISIHQNLRQVITTTNRYVHAHTRILTHVTRAPLDPPTSVVMPVSFAFSASISSLISSLDSFKVLLTSSKCWIFSSFSSNRSWDILLFTLASLARWKDYSKMIKQNKC